MDTEIEPDRLSARVRDVEATVVFPWYVVVSTEASDGWRAPTVGVTDTEAASTTAMCLAVRARGPGCLGVVKRALHHMSEPDYEYLATVCTAVIDPATGAVVVEAGPR